MQNKISPKKTANTFNHVLSLNYFQKSILANQRRISMVNFPIKPTINNLEMLSYRNQKFHIAATSTATL